MFDVDTKKESPDCVWSGDFVSGSFLLIEAELSQLHSAVVVGGEGFLHLEAVVFVFMDESHRSVDDVALLLEVALRQRVDVSVVGVPLVDQFPVAIRGASVESPCPLPVHRV